MTETIPLLAETVRIDTRDVETGRVVVHTTVTERDEEVEAMLTRRDLDVTRVKIDQVVTTPPVTRQEGDVLIIPVLEERLVVEKRLVLVEEIHIRTATSQRTERHTVRLRREQADIQHQPGETT